MDKHTQFSEALQRAISCLPGPNATLVELIRFCQSHDPSMEFKERWGDKFIERTRELWSASTHAFKAEVPTGYSADEVLLCMAQDVTIAPYIGVPGHITHAYLHAMLRELRAKV